MKFKELFENNKTLKLSKGSNVFDKHRTVIALRTLKMSDAGATIMGGMSKAEAREFLQSIGYSDDKIKKIEED
jgi:hypothetical protein